MYTPERDAIINLIAGKGPCTGLEIKQEMNTDPLLIWKICRTAEALKVKSIGTRYLRLDHHVPGFARLSPSILREFFTYSVVGLADDPDALELKSQETADRIRRISTGKFELARTMVIEIMEEFDVEASLDREMCCIIAGDIVYGMAHDVPRPERSTGRLVKGSDIDLVVIVDDAFPELSIRRLDEIIYRKKYRMLINPAINEEVDYTIKRFGIIRNQARFEEFKHMVAIKILQEGVLLYGSKNLFQTAKRIIHDHGLTEKLDAFEKLAVEFRIQAEQAILGGGMNEKEIRDMHLFYSAEEFEEFE